MRIGVERIGIPSVDKSEQQPIAREGINTIDTGDAEIVLVKETESDRADREAKDKRLKDVQKTVFDFHKKLIMEEVIKGRIETAGPLRRFVEDVSKIMQDQKNILEQVRFRSPDTKVLKELEETLLHFARFVETQIHQVEEKSGFSDEKDRATLNKAYDLVDACKNLVKESVVQRNALR